jgi:hypothetical protein
MAVWHTPESARTQWVDAPLDDEQLEELLDVAKGAVLAYAPAIEDESHPPVSYRLAQLTQTKNMWNASYASPSGDLDGGSFGLTTFPLDWQVKQMLRPQSIFGGPVG